MEISSPKRRYLYPLEIWIFRISPPPPPGFSRTDSPFMRRHFIYCHKTLRCREAAAFLDVHRSPGYPPAMAEALYALSRSYSNFLY